MKMRHHQKLAIGIIVVTALAGGMVAGSMTLDHGSTGGGRGAAAGLERYDIGGEFELTNQRGERTRLSELAGNAVMLFFGYTYCPDICPATLARMRAVRAALPPEDAARLVGVLVSVDPARDTPQRLGEYVEFFDPSFLGLTGSETELHAIARRYGAHFEIPDAQPEDAYLVNHSTAGYLIDPVGQVRALYFGDEPVDEMAAGRAGAARRARLRASGPGGGRGIRLRRTRDGPCPTGEGRRNGPRGARERIVRPECRENQGCA